MNAEHKQALIGLCKIEIMRWKAVAESNPNMVYMVELMETAMAALTEQKATVTDLIPAKAEWTAQYGKENQFSCSEKAKGWDLCREAMFRRAGVQE